MKSLLRIILFLAFVSSNIAFGQKGGLPLGDEYYGNQEYSKAKTVYENFVADLENARKVYANYLNCFVQLKELENAEKLIKKMNKWEPQSPVYAIDLVNIYYLQKKDKEAVKQLNRIIKACQVNTTLIPTTTEYLAKNGYFDACKDIYIGVRKAQGNDFLYSLEMAEIFKREKKTDEMIAELLRTLLINSNDKEYIKAKFQDFITTDDEFKKFEALIIERIQENPDQYLYNDLLIWIYVQRKDFYRAFMQARAYDRLMKLPGTKLMEIGRIALENKDYENAGEIFSYVAKEYKNTQNYPLARKYKIQAKEELVKNIFPVAKIQIRSLIADYNDLIVELGRNPQTYEAMRSMAILYGFYLDSKDTSITLLEDVLKLPYMDAQFLAKCKLDLGDMYVLRNEPWEATLLYSQVEFAQKDAPLGYEAKLRNAKLSYYTGQFGYAQAHLDVLKLATTREIANDAMDLSLFIIDNTGLDDDTIHAALQEYANVELYVFQNKYEEAKVKLDSMLIKYKGNSLEDEIYYLQAKIFKKLGKFDLAIERLEAMSNLFKSDIYGDDAAYMLAQIYEENMRDKDKAMELYNKFLIDFPSSIYTSEARKKFRALRGDNLN